LLVGQHLAAGGDPSLEFNAPSALPPASGLVDQSPLRQARQLASQAAVPQERQYAQDALRLADSEVDQAFASTLRSAPPSRLHTSPAWHSRSPSGLTRRALGSLRNRYPGVATAQSVARKLQHALRTTDSGAASLGRP
jgi:hypothetical protein